MNKIFLSGSIILYTCTRLGVFGSNKINLADDDNTTYSNVTYKNYIFFTKLTYNKIIYSLEDFCPKNFQNEKYKFGSSHTFTKLYFRPITICKLSNLHLKYMNHIANIPPNV